MKTPTRTFTRFAIAVMIAAFVYIIIPASKKLVYEVRHVMTEEQKQVLFTRIHNRGFFIGKEGKRPFMIARGPWSELEFHDVDNNKWIKI